MNEYSIASICPSQAWGGLEMNVFRVTEWMVERGWRIINYVHEDSPLREACDRHNFPVEFINSTSKWEDLRWVGKTADSIKRHNCRIAVLHMNKNFLLSVLAKRKSGNFFKFIYEQHMHIGPDKKDWYHNWLYSHLDLWLATIPLLAQQVRDKTNIPEEKIKIVHRGFELDRFVTNQPSQEESRKRLNLPIDATIIGVVGRIDPQKCQHLLIEAAARVHKKGFPVHVAIIGNNSLNETTDYDKRLRTLTNELGLGAYVHFRDFIPEVEYAMSALDIFAMTTESETYGMVTIEAMASGKPVVGTNAGGTIDLVADSERGYLFEPNNSEQLAEKLLKLLNNPDLIQKMGRTGREYAIANLSNVRQCELLEEVFDSLVHKKSG